MTVRPAIRARAGLAVLALALAWPGAAAAQFTQPPAPAAYALKDVTVVHADGRRLEGVNVVVRGRFIEALGPGAAIPADARVLEGDSLVVYPGFVDAQGSVAFEFPREEVDRRRIESWNPPRSVQGFMPSRRVVDHLEATGADLKDQRKKGVVAAAVHPADAMMPGRGALLLLRNQAATPRDLVLTPVLGPVMTLRGGQGVYPATLFGVLAFYRQSFEDASRMRLVAAEYARDPRRLTPPAYDADYAVLQELMAGTTPAFFTANSAEDIRRVLDLSARYKFQPVIVGGEEAWKVADLLKARNIAVLVSLDFPKPERWKPQDKTSEAEKTSPLDPAAEREKRRLENMYANAGRLAAAGVRFALVSGGGKADLVEGARKAIQYGLSEKDALRALTLTPAELLGVPQLARIEVGMPATFLVAGGPIFAKDGKVAYTFVEGELEKGETRKRPAAAADAAADAGAVAGTWEIELVAGDEPATGTLTLKQEGTGFSGTGTGFVFGDLQIKDGKVDGDKVTFSVVVNAGGQEMTIPFTGTLRGQEMTGSGTSPMGEVTFKAKRTAGPGGDR